MKLFTLYKQYQFVFTELVKRDFKKKYKRSFLGVLWSMLAPLFTLLVLNFVFGHFFGRTQEYYTIYLFSGWLIFQYYNEATNGAMNALMANAGIFSKVKGAEVSILVFPYYLQQYQFLFDTGRLFYFCAGLSYSNYLEVCHPAFSNCVYVSPDFRGRVDSIGPVCILSGCAVSVRRVHYGFDVCHAHFLHHRYYGG